MKSILVEKINKEIREDFLYPFETDEGIFLIEIIARAKSWWQNLKGLKSFLKDDDIILNLDSTEIFTSDSKDNDVKAIWNGNELKGLSKTVLIAIKLKKGKHSLVFKPNKSPVLESIGIVELEEADNNTIVYSPIENNPPKSGDRRPWISCVFVDLAIKGLGVLASANKQGRDDEDIKLIINGKIEKNEDKKSHKDWLWCGKVLKGKEKEVTKALNLEKGTHSIELWVDNSPRLEKIEMELWKIKDSSEENKQRIPTVDDPEWTGNFSDDTEQMILARIIFGEARSLSEKGRIAVGWSIKNRIIDPRWSDNYHDVILQSKQYSCLNKGDKNLSFVINPSVDKTQTKDWYKCYEIAGKIISGEVVDPTDGANHYFSDFIDYPYWTKTKQARFKIKIDNTLFYDLKQGNNGGFIKIYPALFLISILVLILGGTCIVAKGFSNSDSIAGQYLENDPVPSPLGGKTGYFIFLNNQEKEIDYNNYIALEIADKNGRNKKEIYRGDYHTSYFEWLNENEVVVYYGCGTECVVGFVIDADTGQKKAELQYGVGYTWSPNKECVFAYNYSGNYGLTIGDKKDDILLSIAREPGPRIKFGLILNTTAAWSLDSQKIALIIKKEKEEKMELLVYERVEKNLKFELIFQKDVSVYNEKDELSWAGKNDLRYGEMLVAVGG